MRTNKVNTPSPTSLLAPTLTAPSTTSQHSSWHSPIPYLFGGLAAMLGLIAFALLILACSYWRLSGQWQQNEEGSGGDLESGEKEGDPEKKEPVKVYEEKILVIMAGDENPTFLATPVSAKSSDFGDGSIGNHSDKHVANLENCDKTEKQTDNNHVVAEANTPRENEGTQQQGQQIQ